MKIPRTAAVLTGIALVAFISLIALVTLFAFVTFFAVDAVSTVCSGSLYARIGFSDPPVAIFTNEGGVAVRTIGAVLSVSRRLQAARAGLPPCRERFPADCPAEKCPFFSVRTSVPRMRSLWY